jgi:hypothetical protein
MRFASPRPLAKRCRSQSGTVPMTDTVKYTVFFAQSAIDNKDPNITPVFDLAKSYFDMAGLTFGMYGIKTDVFPNLAEASSRLILSFNHSICSEDDELSLRQSAHARYPHGDGRLPVIFAPLKEAKRFPPKTLKERLFGDPQEILGYVPDGDDSPNVVKSWLNFVIINSLRNGAAGRTVAHETGHAAGFDHIDQAGKPQPDTNLMYFKDWFSAKNLDPWQLTKLKAAYFVGHT